MVIRTVVLLCESLIFYVRQWSGGKEDHLKSGVEGKRAGLEGDSRVVWKENLEDRLPDVVELIHGSAILALDDPIIEELESRGR